MEKMNDLKITQWRLDGDDDFRELFVWLNCEPPQSSVMVPANDETTEPYHVHIGVNPDTREIVTASILNANNFFDDLARAFASMDLNHPDVRFFLEKKLEQYAQHHRDELVSAPESLEPQAA